MSEQETTERAKYTPGPWRAIGTKVFGLENIVATNQDHPRHYIATVPRATGCHPPGNPDQEANARLIASAPDLLAVIESLHGWDGTGRQLEQICDAADIALAKAKGITK